MDNIFDLSGKTVLITGGSSGLGARFAVTLANAGAKVIIAARYKDKLAKIANLIKNENKDVEILELDVANKQMVTDKISTLRKVDICINSAAIAKQTPLFDVQVNDEFENIIQTNVYGVWYVTKQIALHMKNNNIAGSIINIASINGANKLKENLAAYAASKAAVLQMTKALVGELASCNIRINSIVPGIFHTPLTDYKLNTEKLKKEMAQKIPMKFVADPSDLDGIILYLASNKASRYVTGAHFTIDGGSSWGGS